MLLTLLRNAVSSEKKAILKELLLQRKPTGKTSTSELRQILTKKKSTKMSEEISTNHKPLAKPMLRKEKQQQANKKKNTPYIPGTVTLQVLGAGSNGAPAAVYLFTDQSRYLFNCGEGTQRLAHEHKTKLARLEQIFVTRNTWPAIGGLPGLALTVQDAGVKELSLHGPPFLENILYSMKRFVVLKNLQLKTIDCTETHDFEDGVMSVKCIPLYAGDNCNAQSDNDVNGAAASVAFPKQENVVISYICKLKPRPGPLNLVKCVEHGVPPGPLLGLLKNGIDVTLENGTVVKSKDVSEPNENPVNFIFLDIPSIDFLGNLEKHKNSLLNTNLNPDKTPEIAVIVHFSPSEVLDNNVYRTFVEQFPAATQHIYLNSSQNTFSGYIAAHRIQYQLNQLNPKVFPLLEEANSLATNLSNKLKKTKLQDDMVNEVENMEVTLAECSAGDRHLVDLNPMSYIHLRPRKGLDRAMECKLIPSDYINETKALPDFPTLLEKLKNDFNDLPPMQPTDCTKYPIVTFLGTGSCIPNKTRNVSSILLQAQDNSYIILDCGEGTLGQIQRFFGPAKAEEIIRQLKVIYVSHLHADHHIGLIGLLTERLRLTEIQQEESMERILLLAPKQIEPWLNFYNENIFNIKASYELVGNAELLDQSLVLKETKPNMGIESIATCLVKHCPHSFGVALNISTENSSKQATVKVTYSGDTMPCQDLIELGRNSTILIHEATMEDDLEDEARLKMHSTITQALQQAEAMQAEHVILTHFSQRYAKLPRLPVSNGNCIDDESSAAGLKENVSIAFDNMQISLNDLKNFHLMYPAMRSLFAEHAEELEAKALKRELKLERKRKLSS